jgi:2-polyprenyl-3-methyl-5-hydroxy-6-metoxy-1,4-benzoquinol methylase
MTPMNTDLIAYYKDRAKEYENIYLKPERQDEIKTTTTLLQNLFADKTVFEIACGTGFWTEKIAETATSVFATDINKSVIEVAEQKSYSKKNVTFDLADIFDLSIKTKYESLFGGFIWSHIKLQDLDKFINAINNSILPGSTVVFMDNNFVEGSNHPITKTDIDGNTFQTRKLADSTTHLVLKNFPTESFLRKKFADVVTDLKLINLKYYWVLTYKTRTEKGNR